MISSKNEIRVRYDEVDKMGYVYHGIYARYFHISRTHLLRQIGMCDKSLEKLNIIMPVIEMNIKYLKPVFYDDIISIQTTLLEMPSSRFKFYHEVMNQNNEIINQGNSTLVFVDSITRKPMRVPEIILEKIKLFITHKTDRNEYKKIKI